MSPLLCQLSYTATRMVVQEDSAIEGILGTGNTFTTGLLWPERQSWRAREELYHDRIRKNK
jgi:hypothetical protein